MTTTISFTVPGRMVGKGRPRAFATPDGIRAYTPEATRNAEAMIRDFAARAMKGMPLFEGPVEIFINVWRIPPPSWSKKKRAANYFIVGKPDVDNTLKIILDSIRKIVVADDAQIAVAHIQRRWNPDREETYVLIRSLKNGSLQEPEPKPAPPGSTRGVDKDAGQARPSAVVERNNGGRDSPAPASPQPQNGEPKGVS